MAVPRVASAGSLSAASFAAKESGANVVEFVVRRIGVCVVGIFNQVVGSTTPSESFGSRVSTTSAGATIVLDQFKSRSLDDL